MKTQDIKLDAIEFKDERFRISYAFETFELAPLIRSISEIGLIHPPVITYREQKAIIVTGWKRVLACRSCEMASITCSVFERQNDLEAFRLAVEENLASRPFTLLEKARILSRLMHLGLSEREIVNDHLSLLDIPQTPKYLDAYLQIAALDTETKAVIHSKNMTYPVVELLTEYSEEERRLLMPLLLSLGQNKQKDLLRNLLEISKRDRNPVKNILKGADIQKATKDQNFSALQKADTIRSLIYKQRYPTLAAWTEAFAFQKKNLEWPDGIKIEPSPFFEGEVFKVWFAFKDVEEFQTKLAQLNELVSDEKIARLLKSSPKKDEK
ncbi:MAG: ParB N-terminal domain-containing protein [Candidatus Aminicenantes bacterium]|jgi:ParB-like chromosome segregation protein Spo0J